MPYRQGDLDQIGRRFGLSFQAYYSRNEVRAAMAENLTQAEAVRYALARVEPRLRELYEWLRARDGQAPHSPRCAASCGVEGRSFRRCCMRFEEYALAFDTLQRGRAHPLHSAGDAGEPAPRRGAPAHAVGLREVAAAAVRPADTTFPLGSGGAGGGCLPSGDRADARRVAAQARRAAAGAAAGGRARAQRRGSRRSTYIELLKQEAHELGLVVAPPPPRADARGWRRAPSSIPGRDTIW